METVAQQRVIEKNTFIRLEVYRHGAWDLVADLNMRFNRALSQARKADFNSTYNCSAWRIIRKSDGKIIAQSKNAPATEPSPEASEPDDVLIDEPVPYKPLASFKVKARIGKVRDYTGTQDTAS